MFFHDLENLKDTVSVAKEFINKGQFGVQVGEVYNLFSDPAETDATKLIAKREYTT